MDGDEELDVESWIEIDGLRELDGEIRIESGERWIKRV
jgi:hypothetical protein